MSRNESFGVKLVVLYAVLAVVLQAGFDVDIYSWWTMPAFEALSGLLHHLQAFFSIS